MYRLSGAAFYVLLAALFVLGGMALERRDEIAGSLWRDLGFARPALFFLRSDADLAFEIGERHFGSDRYDLGIAEAAYRKALAVRKDLLGPRYQLARIEFLRGDFSSALDLINEELELHPDYKRSYYVRGLVYGYAKRFREAEEDFLEFIKWDHRSWAAYNDLAWVYFSEGKFAEAERAAAQGLALDPGNPWLLIMRGSALLNLGRMSEAGASFLEAHGAAARLTPEAWGAAYPGNDPAMYGRGLAEMRSLVERNISASALRI